MRVYLISGLGADDSIFRLLRLSNYAITFIPWLRVSMDEAFTDYVKRLSAVIDEDEEFGICGVSLGGICAQEMTRYVNPRFLILISTIKNRFEMPPIMRMAASAKLQKIIPDQFYKWAAMHSGAVIGVKEMEEKELFQKMLDQFGDDYYKWCIKAVAEWEGVSHQVPILRLHGEYDRVFPPAHIKDAEIIAEGNHYMVVNKARQISGRINDFIAGLS